MDYATELKRAMDEAPAPTGLSREELEQHLAAITEDLKGPIGNASRIALCAYRAGIRKALATHLWSDLPERANVVGIHCRPNGPGTVINQTQWTVTLRMDSDGKDYVYGKNVVVPQV